jgi:adenosylcobinamide-GDP ribazoletransferase
MRPGPVDRRIATVAMGLAPVVGAVLGAILAGSGWLLTEFGLAPLPVAAVLVSMLASLTRGLHLDGLADTVDALGSYRDRSGALDIMKSPEVGPMGAAAIGLILLADTAALSALVTRHGWLAIVVALSAGRLAITFCCRRGVPPARPDGLGAMVAGTVPTALALSLAALLLGVASQATDRHWSGALAIAVSLAVVITLLSHVRRRLGGVTGDVLGASCELATALTLLVLSAN